MIALLSGRLHARLRVGSGLWLFARFPERIGASQPVSRLDGQVIGASRSADLRPGQRLISRSASSAKTPEEACSEADADTCSDPCPHARNDSWNDSWNESWNESWNDSWNVRCEGAFRIGLPILVLGAWG
jgi:hypothetical protein